MTRKTESGWIRREYCPLCGGQESRPLIEKEGAVYVQCEECGLVYTDPAPGPEELRQVADEWARKHHAGQHRMVWEGNRTLQEMIYGPRMWRIDQYRYSGRLLDVGCSTGEFLDFAANRGWEVKGCELAQHTAEIARRRCRCEVRCATFEESGFEDGFFDVVTMWDVIEHLFDPGRALEEAWRVLRPGGLLAFITPNYNSISRKILKEKWEGLIPPRHLFVFNATSVKKLVALSGGKVVAVRTVDFNPLDIIGGVLKRRKYGFETRQKNISAVKEIVLRHPRLKIAREFINSFLNATKLGDVLEVYAERAP